MNLQLTSFAEAGNLSKERVIFRALTNLDVGEYVVVRSSVGTGIEGPTAGRKAAYWFPDVEVKANDLIVLYTKKGTRSTKRTDQGRTYYFFYWGKDEPLWGDKQFGAALLEVVDWQFVVPS